jgi:hypothetical protein
MLAPDTRMRPFRGWRRFECKTAAETEQFSRKMAAQQYGKFRSMKIEEHLRSQRKRDTIKANCRLRLASGCISAEDERLTRQTLQSLERKDTLLQKLIFDQPDLSRASLTIEQHEQPQIDAMSTGKRRGLADSDIDAVAALAGSTV